MEPGRKLERSSRQCSRFSSTNMALEYNNCGQFLGSVQAVSLTRPGVFCNAGAMMYDLITVETENLYHPFN